MKLNETKKVDTNLYELNITVDGEQYAKALDASFKKNASKLNIPGFRKGKAPKSIVYKMVGESYFYEDAINSSYGEAYEEALKEFLPMSDNLQRSLAYAGTENFAKGIEMIVNQFSDTLKKLGIEEYGKRGDPFDPNIHNAVMRTDDDSLGENTVAEVLQKGYRKGDKILRFAMVKVAN